MSVRSSVAALRSRYRDDYLHSDYVEQTATSLFTATQQYHRVTPCFLPLLQAGALLHDIGRLDDPQNSNLRGRDIVLQEGIRGFTDEETALIASIISFHRRKVTPESDPAWCSLSESLRDAALRLAAIVRIAYALDCVRDQSVKLVDIRGTHSPRVSIRGDRFLDRCLKRVDKRTDVWKSVTGIPFRFGTAKKSPRMQWPQVRGNQTLAESAPRVLNMYLCGVISQARSVGGLNAVDPRHDMRVSLRRFRAALRSYRRMWRPGYLDELTAELKWFGELLGAVRDADVSLEWIDEVKLSCPVRFRGEFDVLRGQTERRRRDSLRRLIPALRDERFPGMLQNAARCIRDIETDSTHLTAQADRQLSRRISRTMSRHIERLAAGGCGIEEHNAEELHALRIETRRMRYAVEAWYSALGPGRKALQRNLLAVQDTLGDIHDADVRMHETFTDMSEDLGVWLRSAIGEERHAAWSAFQDAWPELLRCFTASHFKRVIS